jgi:hypothetical protein
LGSCFAAGCDALASSIRDSTGPHDADAAAVGPARTRKAVESALALDAENQRRLTRASLKGWRIALAEELA